MQIHELRCFGTRPGQGNPALVVEGDAMDQQQRQAFARQQNKSACIFLSPEPDGAGYLADYFYPHMRSPLCLHATLAAAEVLFARLPHEHPLRLKTAMRGQLLTLTRGAQGSFISLAPQPAPELGIPAGLPAVLLDAPGIELVSAPALASVGSPKLLIEVQDRAILYALRPKLDLIAHWGKTCGVSGCYVYCRLGDGAYEGRNFNHLDPALEDSATGVAAGALSVLLGHGLDLYQGSAVDQPCLIRTRCENGQILIGGRAEK